MSKYKELFDTVILVSVFVISFLAICPIAYSPLNIYNFLMKKILFSFFCFFVVQNINACPNLLNSDMRILDSAETQNLCAYEGKTLIVVKVASRCGYT